MVHLQNSAHHVTITKGATFIADNLFLFVPFAGDHYQVFGCCL
jgi:hypothetical protein